MVTGLVRKCASWHSRRIGIVAQVAALPIRRDPDGSHRVLLVTSRETRRWITPKGGPGLSMRIMLLRPGKPSRKRASWESPTP
jgi:hypothetical protein